MPGTAIAALVRAHPRLAVAWFGTLALFLGRALLEGDQRVWAYLTVVLVLTAVVALTDRHVHLSDTALVLLLLAGVAHLAGGLLPGPDGAGVLYDRWLVPEVLRYDQAVHALGSVAATVASWQLLGTYLDLARCRPRTQAVCAGLMAMGKGGINEALEFLAASQPGTFVGGFDNTGWDLVFDLAGVTAAGAFLVVSRAARRPAPATPAALVEAAPTAA